MEGSLMYDLFGSWKYKFLMIFSIVGTFIFGAGANYFFPNLENDFFVLLFWFGGSSLILSIVLSLGESHPPEEVPGEENHA
jgi:hypothetical protein